MGKLILGFIVGFVLSDWIASTFPQTANWRIQPSGSLPATAQTTGAQIATTPPATGPGLMPTGGQCVYPTLQQGTS